MKLNSFFVSLFTVSLLAVSSGSEAYSQVNLGANSQEIRVLSISEAEKIRKNKAKNKNRKTTASKNTKKTRTTKASSKTKAAKSRSSGTSKESVKKNFYKDPVERKSSVPSIYPVDLTAENPLLPTTPKLINQRKYFADAETAIKSGDVQKALSIRDSHLKDYPLAVWIDYWYLSIDPMVSKYSKVVEFINNSDHRELSSILKNKYIDFMAKAGKYKQVAELIGKKKPFDDDMEMNSSQMSLQCRFYEARWHSGMADVTAQIFANKIYMQLKKYPSACDGLISIWSRNGYLTQTTKLDKFERAYIARNYSETTRNLAYSLSSSKYSEQVELAMSLYDEPQRIMNLDARAGDETQRRAAVLAFKRYANLNPKDAAPSFNLFSEKFHITQSEKLDVISVISRGFLGRKSTLEDVAWVDKNLPAIEWSEEIKLMRMRRAIWFGQWQTVYDLYNHLSSKDKEEINWRYWKARSALEVGFADQGRRLMNEVAKDRSFFGFLAAQELGKKLPFNHEKLSKSAVWPGTVAKNPAAVRFFEFRILNSSNASVEWKEVAKYGTKDEAMLMAEWALINGNVNYAITSVIAGKRWDALDYRFPKAFLNLYEKYSRVTNVPISFLYGISRQESMLNPTIKSPVGAVGLMQLMPTTAQMVSRKNHWPYSGTSDLVIPENNIRLGSAYLRDMLNKFDNNRILAAAAYNAGPNRVKIWKSDDGRKRDTAMYVENIPFKETRIYVQNVLLYDVIYKKLLTGKEDTLLKVNERKYSY